MDQQFRLKGPEGEWRWLHVISNPVFDFEGKPEYYNGITIDITEQKEAKQALYKKERFHEGLLNDMITFVAVLDPSGDIIFVNNTPLSVGGIKLEDIIGKKFFDTFWWTHSDEVREMIKRDIEQCASGESIIHDVPIQTADGSLMWIEFSMHPIHNEYGVVQYLIPEGRDITTNREAQEALRESEEHHRSFTESAKGFIVYRLKVDPENYFSGRLIFVSPGIEDEIGVSPEAEFSEWFNNIHPDDLPGLIEVQAKTVRNGDTFDQEFRWKNIKGEWEWCHAISNPVFDSDGKPKYYNGMVIRITAQKQANKALQKSEKDLKGKKIRLEELNTALKILLEKGEKDREELEEKVIANVKEMVLPYVVKLKSTGLDEIQETFTDIIESNLDDIISPFLKKISSKYLNFTPTELRVADLVKQGLSTKEIGNLLNSSPETITGHRKSIRKKLQLKDKKSNLRTRLLSLQ